MPTDIFVSTEPTMGLKLPLLYWTLQSAKEKEMQRPQKTLPSISVKVSSSGRPLLGTNGEERGPPWPWSSSTELQRYITLTFPKIVPWRNFQITHGKGMQPQLQKRIPTEICLISVDFFAQLLQVQLPSRRFGDATCNAQRSNNIQSWRLLAGF